MRNISKITDEENQDLINVNDKMKKNLRATNNLEDYFDNKLLCFSLAIAAQKVRVIENKRGNKSNLCNNRVERSTGHMRRRISTIAPTIVFAANFFESKTLKQIYEAYRHI